MPGLVAAGPAGKHPEPDAVGDTTPRGDLAVWSAESTALLLAALKAAGRPEPLPAAVAVAVAVDAIDEFLTVEYGTCGAWPHSPARVALHTAEGPSWLLDLTPAGDRLLAWSVLD